MYAAERSFGQYEGWIVIIGAFQQFIEPFKRLVGLEIPRFKVTNQSMVRRGVYGAGFCRRLTWVTRHEIRRTSVLCMR